MRSIGNWFRSLYSSSRGNPPSNDTISSDQAYSSLISANPSLLTHSYLKELLDRYLLSGNHCLIMKLCELDPDLYDSNYFSYCLERGHPEIALLFMGGEDHLWLKKAWIGDDLFPLTEFMALPTCLHNKIFQIANSYNRQRLVAKLKLLGIKGSSPDVVEIQERLSKFFWRIRSPPSTAILESGNFGQILTGRYLQRIIKELGLTKVHVPEYYASITSKRLRVYLDPEIGFRTEGRFQIFRDPIVPVYRCLTQLEFVELITLMLTVGYRDPRHIVLTEDSVALVQVEYKMINSPNDQWRELICLLSPEDQPWAQKILGEKISEIKFQPFSILPNYPIYLPFEIDSHVVS